MTRHALAAAAIITVLATGGCGSSGNRGSFAHTTVRATSRTQTSSSPTALENGVRQAIEQDHRLSIQSLWTNHVPAHPHGIAGPALSHLRQAVAERRRQRLRVRMLSERFRVLSIELAPTYTTAMASVLDAERVQVYRDGRQRGKSSASTEHVRLLLHRVGQSDRFDVWRVTLT